MVNKLDESKEYFEKWLNDKEAKDVKVLDDNDSITPYYYQVHGIVDGRWCHAIFYTNLHGKSGINLDYKGTHGKDLTAEEFKKILDSMEIRKPEHTLERFKLKHNEQLIVTYEMCTESNDMRTFYEIKEKLN